MKIPRKKVAIFLISLVSLSLVGTVSSIFIIRSGIQVKVLPSNGGWMGPSVLIKYNDMNIYIDPSGIDDKYENQKADIIFLTHPHWDHYYQKDIDKIKDNSTNCIGPTSCSLFITQNNGTGVSPNDTGTIGEISYEAIPAYNGGHPKSNNWCGYIITVDGYRILHMGDTTNIPELINYQNQIDLLLLPVGGDCGNLNEELSLLVIQAIIPKYIVPIHYGKSDIGDFIGTVESEFPSIKVASETLLLF